MDQKRLKVALDVLNAVRNIYIFWKKERTVADDAISLDKHYNHKWSRKIWRFKQTSRINTEKAAEVIKRYELKWKERNYTSHFIKEWFLKDDHTSKINWKSSRNN